MTASDPVIAGAAYCLAHVPDLVAWGSKPRREIALDASFEPRLRAQLRTFAKAVAYPPNQTFIGNSSPEVLGDIDRPWYETRQLDANSSGELPFKLRQMRPDWGDPIRCKDFCDALLFAARHVGRRQVDPSLTHSASSPKDATYTASARGKPSTDVQVPF